MRACVVERAKKNKKKNANVSARECVHACAGSRCSFFFFLSSSLTSLSDVTYIPVYSNKHFFVLHTTHVYAFIYGYTYIHIYMYIIYIPSIYMKETVACVHRCFACLNVVVDMWCFACLISL